MTIKNQLAYALRSSAGSLAGTVGSMSRVL